MSANNPLKQLVKGAAFTTGAALLVPLNVVFLLREAWAPLIGTVCVQVVLLAIGLTIMRQAHRASRQ